MSNPKVLFISWQVGMGHITRDIAIAQALRSARPGVDIVWLAQPLACKVLHGAGETILEHSGSCADYNLSLSKVVAGFRFNVMDYWRESQEARESNVQVLRQVLRDFRFDLIIGDEIYEVADAVAKGTLTMSCPIVMVEDFIGSQPMTDDRLEQLAVQRTNRILIQQASLLKNKVTRLFVGELEDIPDEVFGSPPVRKRYFARLYYTIVGYVVRFDPAQYGDRDRIRARLGYSSDPLIVCATGGTAAGKEVLELRGRSYSLLKASNPGLRMLFVCGELYGKEQPNLPAGVDVRSYVDKLYEHYAACDMAVVVGGGTTTIELSALRRPFVYFPLEGQFDQEVYIAERLTRHGAGIGMSYRETSPERLAEVISKNMGRQVTWAAPLANGASVAAGAISRLLP